MDFCVLIVILNFLDFGQCNDAFEEVVNSEDPPLRTLKFYTLPPLPFTPMLPWAAINNKSDATQPIRRGKYFLPPPPGHHLPHQHHRIRPTDHPVHSTASHTENLTIDMSPHQHYDHHQQHGSSAAVDKQHLLTTIGTEKPGNTNHKSNERQHGNSADHSDLKELHSGHNVTGEHHEHTAWNSSSSAGNIAIVNSLLILLMCKLAV